MKIYKVFSFVVKDVHFFQNIVKNNFSVSNAMKNIFRIIRFF